MNSNFGKINDDFTFRKVCCWQNHLSATVFELLQELLFVLVFMFWKKCPGLQSIRDAACRVLLQTILNFHNSYDGKILDFCMNNRYFKTITVVVYRK